mmetsp:Transcript_14181/g.17915  ORF Transcript_14181/g.17915 Transcript_14181/m.17915 type:complete len:110 (-) Transcript_14181:21-350(-)
MVNFQQRNRSKKLRISLRNIKRQFWAYGCAAWLLHGFAYLSYLAILPILHCNSLLYSFVHHSFWVPTLQQSVDHFGDFQDLKTNSIGDFCVGSLQQLIGSSNLQVNEND